MSGDGKKRGAAMVIVLCVLAVFLALSATILLSGSVALNTARTNIIFERSKVQAVSLSNAIVRDMKRPLVAEDSYLPHYVREQIMGDWPLYDEETDNRESAVRTFTMDESAEKEHQIRIEMYWTGDGKPEEGEDEEDEFGSIADKKNIRLHIDVVSTLNSSEYRVSSVFKLSGIEKNDAYKEGEDQEDGNYPYIWNWEPEGRQL